MNFSRFGQSFSHGAGIVQLMDDLGDALAVNRDMLMLGGGNPAWIPEVQARFRDRMMEILANGNEFERLVGDYDPPQGEPEFIQALASLLHREYGWAVGPRNIAVTNGSQCATFMLFNLFAGTSETEHRQILMPLTPEYIGYSDQGLGPDFFVSQRPTIEHLSEHVFKYRVDFDALRINQRTAAICASRPTNPTGNVLTDAEVEELVAMAKAHDIPLILDSAYGTPFPNIIFTDATPVWNESIIQCMSLSKLGLPGVRTGIVIAREDIIRAVRGVNAILNLTTGGFGPALTLDLVRSGEVLEISRKLIRPFYEERAKRCVEHLHRQLHGYDFHVHDPEGAIFLWLWFRDLPVTSAQLYERLKARGVLVIAGHHFFPGLATPWTHTQECLRVTYAQPWETVVRGLDVIADEVKRAYDETKNSATPRPASAASSA